MTATSIFIRINVWFKFALHFSTVCLYFLLNHSPSKLNAPLRSLLQGAATSLAALRYGEHATSAGQNWTFDDRSQDFSHLFYIAMIATILHLIDRQVEYILALNLQWSKQFESDRLESQSVGQINRLLLENILPPHVLRRYLYSTSVSYDQLYHESVSDCSASGAHSNLRAASS